MNGSYRINDSKIGRITTKGQINEYSRHLDSTSEPTGIAQDPTATCGSSSRSRIASAG